MPQRLAHPLDIAQATADLVLATTTRDEAHHHDLLDEATVDSLGTVLARHGDEQSLRILEASARRAGRGAEALRAELRDGADVDGIELTCVNQVTSMFRLVSVAAAKYRRSATAPAKVSPTQLLATASPLLADEISSESIDRVRYSMVVTRQLLDSVQRRANSPDASELEPDPR